MSDIMLQIPKAGKKSDHLDPFPTPVSKMQWMSTLHLSLAMKYSPANTFYHGFPLVS